MDRKLLFGLVLAVLSSPVAAQDTYSTGQTAADFATRPVYSSVHPSKVFDAPQMSESKRNAQATQILQSLWAQLGIPQQSAQDIASSFRWNPSMDVALRQAQREGFERTMDEALKALSSTEYDRANQLMLAAQMVAAR